MAFSVATRVYNAHLVDGTNTLPGARGTGPYAARSEINSPVRVFLQDAHELQRTSR